MSEKAAPQSRRSFLKTIPVLTVGTAVLPARAVAGTSPHWAMLVDLCKCVGCQACTVACIAENAVPEDSFRTITSTYAVARSNETQPASMYFLPRLCNHCDDPPCVAKCPVNATSKREDGVVLVDGERCVGCAYCVQACPYDGRFLNHDTGKADKCTLCAHRLDAGLLPACVETCVGGGRIFGDLNDSAGELRREIDAHKEQLKVLKPEMKTRPNVYYIGLDSRFQGRVEGQVTVWYPSIDGDRQ